MDGQTILSGRRTLLLFFYFERAHSHIIIEESFDFISSSEEQTQKVLHAIGLHIHSSVQEYRSLIPWSRLPCQPRE